MAVKEVKTGSPLDQLPEGWQKVVVGMYAQGASDSEIRGELRMTVPMWDALYDSPTDTLFRQVVDFGRVLAKAWWMKQGRLNLENKQFNSSLWLMNMKNRFGWADKQEVTSKDVSQMSADELDAAVEKAIRRFNKTVVR